MFKFVTRSVISQFNCIPRRKNAKKKFSTPLNRLSIPLTATTKWMTFSVIIRRVKLKEMRNLQHMRQINRTLTIGIVYMRIATKNYIDYFEHMLIKLLTTVRRLTFNVFFVWQFIVKTASHDYVIGECICRRNRYKSRIFLTKSGNLNAKRIIVFLLLKKSNSLRFIEIIHLNC